MNNISVVRTIYCINYHYQVGTRLFNNYTHDYLFVFISFYLHKTNVKNYFFCYRRYCQKLRVSANVTAPSSDVAAQSADVSASRADIVASNGECSMKFHNVLRVFHGVLLRLTMFYNRRPRGCQSPQESRQHHWDWQ